MVALRIRSAHPVKLTTLTRTGTCCTQPGLFVEDLGLMPLPAVDSLCRWRPFGPLTPEFEIGPLPEFADTFFIRAVDGTVRFCTRGEDKRAECSELHYRSVHHAPREAVMSKIGCGGRR